MSEQMSAEEIRSELKKALIIGDIHSAEKLLMQARSVEAFSPMEQVRIQQAIEQAKFGVTNPMQNPELYALAVKL